MFKLTQAALLRKGQTFRYIYFLVSGFRYVPFFVWQRRGEPNPFVARTIQRSAVTTSEIDDLMKANRSQFAPLI